MATDRACEAEALHSDLGWGLGVLFRAYAKASREAVGDVPGGPRGLQVLVAAAGEQTGTQLALARRLGVDRTVMTYLLDDLESAGLIRRLQDPQDRRARRVAVTPAGQELISRSRERLSIVEAHLLSILPEADREAFRADVQSLAVELDGPGHEACAGTPCEPVVDAGAAT